MLVAFLGGRVCFEYAQLFFSTFCVGSHWHALIHEILNKNYFSVLKRHHRVDHVFGQAIQNTSFVAPLLLTSIENVRSGVLFSIQATTAPNTDNIEILQVWSFFESMLGCGAGPALHWVRPVLGLVLRRWLGHQFDWFMMTRHNFAGLGMELARWMSFWEWEWRSVLLQVVWWR